MSSERSAGGVRRADRSWSAQQLGASSAPSSGPRSGDAFRLPVLSRCRSRRGRQRSSGVDKDVSSGGGCAAQVAQANVKVLGSAGRADVAAAPTGGARSQAAAPSHRRHIGRRLTSSSGTASIHHRSHRVLRRVASRRQGDTRTACAEDARGQLRPRAAHCEAQATRLSALRLARRRVN